MDPTNYSSLWEAFRNAAVVAREKQLPAVAESTLLKALTYAEEFLELDSGLVHDIHRIVDSYCANGNFDAAEHLCRRVLEARVKILGMGHLDVRDSLERLVAVLQKANQQREVSLLENDAPLFKEVAVIW